MKKLTFKITINASAKKVWQVLWTDFAYRQWTSVFQEGSYAASDWKEGSKIHFLTNDGQGMYSVIAKCIPAELMSFHHQGVIKNFIEQPQDEETKQWGDSFETYSLKEDNGITTLEVTLDSIEKYLEYFGRVFPKAIAIVKELSEKPFEISIHAEINSPVEKAWKFWITPEDITQWNTASDDWFTPRAENDLRVGGKFLSRMEARDGSFGFDFWGIYDEVKTNERIAYTMGDGRKARVDFLNNGKSTAVNVVFEAETENSIELQQGGWQAILNSFKKYAEKNS